MTDYIVDPADPLSTSFKFSRFSATSAPPRDITKLNPVDLTSTTSAVA